MAWLYELARDYPDVTQLVTIGLTAEGRNMTLIKVNCEQSMISFNV